MAFSGCNLSSLPKKYLDIIGIISYILNTMHRYYKVVRVEIRFE